MAEWGTGAWIVVSLVSLVALASIGGVLIGVPMVRITPAIERAPDCYRKSFGMTCEARSSRSRS